MSLQFKFSVMDLFENEWFIEAPWGRICIVAWGNCLDTPVLVSHGERDSAASYRPLMRLLPANFYYVGIELPGHGKSDCFPPGMPVSLLDLVYSLELVRRHFRWDQFIYMAHSAAGTIGRLYNLSHPGRISRAIEIDQITPRFSIQMDQFDQWYEKSYGEFFAKYHVVNAPKETGPKYTWAQAIEKVLSYRHLTPELARSTIERWSEPAGDGFIRFTYDQRLKYLLRPPFTAEQTETLFTSLQTPTVAVVAKGSIAKGLFKKTPFLLGKHGNYRVYEAEGEHDVFISNPERVAPYVSQFLLHGIEGLDNKAKL